jgi:hypothetical protein
MKESRAGSERERKRREHAQRVLQKQGKQAAPAAVPTDSSVFESLFSQRAQGFQMEFAFRNAPPRPPVGPCFTGHNVEGKLQDCSKYQPLQQYIWKLHSEPDLGVPLAPSAMDLSCYQEGSKGEEKLHPDDEALLNWSGSLGDTAAEQLKVRQDKARAAARLALAGHKVPKSLLVNDEDTAATGTQISQMASKKKKEFSRVLDERMQSWMKATTYLSNDYSKKVHDFTSLAKTKQKTAQQLEQAQAEMDRSADAVARTFAQTTTLKHPTKPHLKAVSTMPLLPDVDHWGHAYTHVVLDNPPKKQQQQEQKEENTGELLQHAFVAHVEKKEATARMNCQLLVPDASAEQENDYRVLQLYDLDVVPLKDEDGPHVNFCLFLDEDGGTSSYMPISSRVQLSTGRPPKKQHTGNLISRRELSAEDASEMRERLAEVDADAAKEQEEAAAKEADDTQEDAAASYNPVTAQRSDDSDVEMEEDEPAVGESSFGAPKTITAEG